MMETEGVCIYRQMYDNLNYLRRMLCLFANPLRLSSAYGKQNVPVCF